MRALDGVSLSLAPGRIVGLLGPNGAGKSTLVRAICGRVRLDAGSVRLDERDPRVSPAARRVLGLVPQEIALYPELTARENLEVLGRLAGLDRRAARTAAARALGWCGLEARAGDRASRLSGGLQRRLNLAAGVLHEPRVLLLDEPTVGIDPPAREAIHDLLRDLRARGTALLLATHDLDQAAELCDEVALLVDGRIRAQGTTAELVAQAFGTARELTVALAPPAPQAARVLLIAAGLTPDAPGRRFTGPFTGGLADTAPLEARLAAAGATLVELRLREPGLRGVFFRVAGRELAS
ncbi:MAG: ABC transporter ATP-binding protein [Vicinamibacteria bacterium]